jgi:5-methyltetrahydrofolate--homocysteine methyltransferase
MDFGPGVAAAFAGAKLDNSSGRVWFSAHEVLPIGELHIEFDSNNIWLNRVMELCREGMNRWQGQVLISMVDLGGVLDILSSFRTAENLLMDLYDSPQEVERVVWEIHGLWHKCYDAINDVLRPVNPGYSDWSGIYSSKPSYILQCDFSYMISPGMFDRFVKPELAASCKKLPNTFYHLDGIGELPHLDSLLTIGELGGVQWVPGDGKPSQIHWIEVFEKIGRAGKKTQVWGFDCLDAVIAQIGSPGSIQCHGGTHPAEMEEELCKRLAKYGIE